MSLLPTRTTRPWRVVRLGLALALALSGLLGPSTRVLAQTVVATVGVGSNPVGVGVNPGTRRVYVANVNSNTVSVIDGNTNTVIATIGVGSVPEGLAVNPTTGRIYVANEVDDTVSVIDGITNAVIATVGTGPAPIAVGVNPSTNRVYVSNSSSNTVSVIDGNTNTVIATIGVGAGPFGVGVNPSTGRVYVASRFSDTVSVIDGATNTVIATVGVGSFPEGLAVNPSTGHVYVANTSTHSDPPSTVSVIDGNTNAVIATVGVGSAPVGVGLNASTGHVYIANSGGKTVSVIDGNTNTVIATVGVGSTPEEVGVNPRPGRVYVSNYSSNTVSVFQDTAGNTPATLTLAPAAATNPVGTQHCVTANAKDASATPTPDITVRFSIRGAVTTSGTKTTDANGQATFCYPGPELPGADAIAAFADTNNNGTQDAGEPNGTATKKWTLPVSSPGCAAMNRGRITANHGDKATFDGQAKGSSDGKTVRGQETYYDQRPGQPLVKSLNVQAVTCNLSAGAKQASIFGQATIKGAGQHTYKIDITDSGDPGTNDTFRILLDIGYDSGVHKLETGKVEIRQK